jgi:hypothetical protein
MRDRLDAAIDRVPPVVRAVAAVIAFAGMAVWLTVSTYHGISPSRADVGTLTDFRDAIYYPLVALRDGVNPYAVDVYFRHYPVGQEFPLYSPVHLLLHSPLLLFSFPVARAVFWGWNLLLVLGFAAVLLRLAAHRVTVASLFGLGTVIVLADAGKFDLRSGQPTLMVVIAFLLAWRAPPRADRGWWPAAVGVIGVAVVWSKPTYALPLILFLLLCGRVRTALRGTALAIVLSAIVLPFLVDAAGGLSPFVDSIRDAARITSESKQSKLGTGLRIDVANTLVRITRVHYSETVGALIGLALLAAGAWLVWRLHRRDARADTDELVIALVSILTLIGTYHVSYDYLLLFAPLILLVRRRPTCPTAWPRRVRPTVAALLALPTFDVLGWSPVNRVLGKSGFEWMLHPTMYGVYVLTALGLCGWTAFRQLRLPVDDDAAAPAAAGPVSGGERSR